MYSKHTSDRLHGHRQEKQHMERLSFNTLPDNRLFEFCDQTLAERRRAAQREE